LNSVFATFGGPRCLLTATGLMADGSCAHRWLPFMRWQSLRRGNDVLHRLRVLRTDAQDSLLLRSPCFDHRQVHALGMRKSSSWSLLLPSLPPVIFLVHAQPMACTLPPSSGLRRNGVDGCAGILPCGDRRMVVLRFPDRPPTRRFCGVRNRLSTGVHRRSADDRSAGIGLWLWQLTRPSSFYCRQWLVQW